MANVLPPQDRTRYKRIYRLRVLIVGALVVTAAFVVGSVSLTPAYFIARAGLIEAQQYQDVQEQTRAATREDTAVQTARFVRTQMDVLQQMTTTDPTDTLTRVLRVWEEQANDIVLSSISYDASGDAPVRVSGRARNREALSVFVAHLRAERAFETVELPLSDLAGDADTTFSLVIVPREE